MSIDKLVIGVIMAYIVIASVTYRFQHPGMTETELFLNLPNALLFR